MVEEKDETLVKHLAKQGVDDKMVMGHPAGLFVLFFTEMWERFSYYGMRALLTLFLVSSIASGGWEWTRSDALQLYGWYTGLVYLTPIIGGIIADKLTGYRKAILVGALIMTLGHASMALEGFSTSFFFLSRIIRIYLTYHRRNIGYKCWSIFRYAFVWLYRRESRLALWFWISWCIHVFWNASVLFR